MAEASKKDFEQDALIRENAVRIAKNEEAIKRQTEALEKIRDHFYPKKTMWKNIVKFLAKVSCAVFAYLGIAETVDWIWNSRESNALAEKYAKTAKRLFFEEGDAMGAMKCYEKAAEIDPKESEYVTALTFMHGMAMTARLTTTERALTDEEQTQIDEAYAEATVLRTLRPDDPLPLVLMAQALMLNGEKQEAVRTIRQAVACKPDSVSVRTSACAIQFYSGQPDAARRDLAEAERLDGSYPLMILWKGVLAMAIDHDAVVARKCFEALVRRMPRQPLAHLMLGRSLLLKPHSDIPGARAAFRRALMLDAQLTMATLGLAETYEREGNLLVARLWLDRTLAHDDRLTKALAARARIDVALGELDAAETDWTAAIALAPFEAKLYRQRAEARAKAGNAAGSASDLATAQALEKTDEHPRH